MKVSSKRELLNGLTRLQLKSLADEMEVEYEHSWRKDEFVEALACSRKINSMGVEELANRIRQAGSVSAAVRSTRQEFFDDTAGSVFRANQEIALRLSNAICLEEIIDPGYITGLNAQIANLKDSRICHIEEVPKHIWGQLSPKQKGAYGSAKSLTRQISRFVESATGAALTDRTVVEYSSWRRRELPDRISYYVCQAYRSYVAKCYDGCIVMLARAVEYSLKEALMMKTSIPQKATLGSLIDLYRKNIGNDKVLEKILEVANMDRVISAHDIPPYEKQMQSEDANHAWTAIEIIFRELMPSRPKSQFP